MIKRQDETGALSCRISCCPPSVKRGGYLLPSFHPVPSSGGGPGNSFGEVAFIWRQNILIYLKRKVLTMHWMYIYLSVGDHNEYISIGLDRSQPLFYFVPQEKWFSQSSWLDYIGPKSDHCLALVPNTLTDMFVILDWCDPGVWRYWVHTTPPC